jgi:hypothetical protein
MSMKALMGVVFALTAALASPAVAEAASSHSTGAYQSYAHHPARSHSIHRGWNVYNSYGGYSTDPDPFIRDQLRRCHEC